MKERFWRRDAALAGESDDEGEEGEEGDGEGGAADEGDGMVEYSDEGEGGESLPHRLTSYRHCPMPPPLAHRPLYYYPLQATPTCGGRGSSAG